jgi:hypothetical protein
VVAAVVAAQWARSQVVWVVAAAVELLHLQGLQRQQQQQVAVQEVVAATAAAAKQPQGPLAAPLLAQQALRCLTTLSRLNQQQQQEQHQTAEVQEGRSCGSAMMTVRRRSWHWQHHPAFGRHQEVLGTQQAVPSWSLCLQGLLHPASPAQHLQQMRQQQQVRVVPV